MKCTRRQRRPEDEPVERRASPPGRRTSCPVPNDGRDGPSLRYPAPTRFKQYNYNKLMTDSFIIAGRQFHSRLIVGTGKYKSFQETARALEASGADMVTVAVRRVNLDRSKESLLDYIDPNRYFLLPNTAGCYTADDTIRTARL